MKTYYDRLSITILPKDKAFVKKMAEHRNCSVSKFIQRMVFDYRQFEAYRQKAGEQANTLRNW